MISGDELARIERLWTNHNVRFAQILAKVDPVWGSVAVPIADGHAVLCGPGLYVNRALGLGLDPNVAVTSEDLARLEAASATVGVPAEVEVTELTQPSLVALLEQRGYTGDASNTVTAFTRRLTEADLAPAKKVGQAVKASFVGDDLELWQEVSARSWGHATAAARAAADAFAAVAHIVDQPGLLIATDGTDARPLGAASLAVTEDIATLGGMSTLPSERRRGVQSALITYRLSVAYELGATLAVSTASSGSDSERNLLRHGFGASHTKTTWSRA